MPEYLQRFDYHDSGFKHKFSEDESSANHERVCSTSI